MSQPFVWHASTRLLCEDAAYAALRTVALTGQSLRVAGGQVTGIATPTPQLLCETSGSFGQPKVIQRTPASWQQSFNANAPVLDLCPNAVMAVFAGPSSSLALYAVLEAAHHGASILPLNGLRPDRQALALAKAKATLLYITPTQLGLLCATGNALPDVRYIMVGGGRLSPDISAAATQMCPTARLTQFYGASETSFITWTDVDTPAGSVGRAYPGVTLRLDATGGIWVKSPYLFEGYAAGESADTRWQDDYLTVGEIGYMDTSGHLFLTGRNGRMVTIADHNVYPDQVEACLADLTTARTIAVVALPDPKRGSRLVALVAGATDVTEDALLRACRVQMAPSSVPHRIHLVDNLPLLPAGKPDYIAITALAGRMT